jgi:hypothetical protein
MTHFVAVTGPLVGLRTNVQSAGPSMSNAPLDMLRACCSCWASPSARSLPPGEAARSPRSGPSEKRNDDLGTTRCGCDATGYSTDWSFRYGRFVHAIQG